MNAVQEYGEVRLESGTFPSVGQWYRVYYLHTPHWGRVSEGARQRAGHRCEECASLGRKGEGIRVMEDEPVSLEVHHLRYAYWEEQPDDLLVLCRTCHEKSHRLDSVGRRTLEVALLEKWRQAKHVLC